MRFISSRTLPVLLLGALAAPVSAQGPQYAPAAPQPTVTTQGTANIVAVPAYQPPPIVNVNGYAPPGSGYYPSNPYGGYLSGRADLVNARANANLTDQQAALTQEQVFRSQLDTRRAILNEARYERETTPNSEQVRLRGINDALRRARNEPPLNEIWSGDSLNSLYTDIKNAHTYGVRGPIVPLDQAILKNINLTTGVTSGSLGVLKDGPKLRWPVILQNSNFDENRRQLEMQVAKALTEAMKGPVSLDLVSDLQSNIDTMQVILKQMVNDVGPEPYMNGKKYLRELTASCATLRDPNVANYFNGTWVAQGQTVYDLADYMTKNGLKFAPSVSGEQAAYSALYQSILTYDVRLSQAVSR